MGYVVLVEELDCIDNLLENRGSFPFREPSPTLMQIIEESAISSILQNQIGMQLILEVPIKMNDVGVVAKRLQPNFLSNLLLHLILANGELADLFDCYQHTCKFVPMLKSFYFAK